jgi:hypothetical protein
MIASTANKSPRRMGTSAGECGESGKSIVKVVDWRAVPAGWLAAYYPLVNLPAESRENRVVE